MNIKSLAKDTAIYGLSSIIGRFLNYLLVPLYTYKIAAQSGDYGIVTNLYAYTALFLAILTFGMETTLFRFSNKEGEDSNLVYGTILRIVGGLSLCFVVLTLAFLKPLSEVMNYSSHPEYLGCMAIIVAFDAVQAIMFSKLRQQGKAVKFMCLKFSFIIPNILLNLFIFLVLPGIPALCGLIERFNSGVGLIFFSNLICTTLVFVGFCKELKGFCFGFDGKLAGRLLRYSWPLLILSLVGILNQVADKILYPHLVTGLEGQIQLGVYGACVKIAMIMSLLTQAFRYAYEPIIFRGSRDKNSPENLADGMKYFIIFTMLAYLAVVFYMPILKHYISPSYWEGLKVVPIVMAAEIFMGIYFNLSFWYKLTDNTHWGAIMSAIGAAVMIAINIVFVPKYGYMACAWGGLAGYGTSMLISFFLGQKKYPVKYDLKSIGLFIGAAVLAIAISHFCFRNLSVPIRLILRTLLLLAYASLILRTLKKNKEI